MKEKLAPVLNTEKESLRALCNEIYSHPELALEEFHACAVLKDYLRKQGFTVQDNAGDLETAFVGFCSSEGASESVPLLGFIAEYDALPGMGHGCGHNLIAVSAVAASLAARQILEEKKIPYRLCCIGTPAEEGKGGKILMLQKGVFDGVSAILEAHPGHKTTPDVGELSVQRCTVKFHGKAAHAAICPEKGLNALEAACDFVCALKEWKKTLGKRERVHGILTKGGEVPNIIPAYAEAFYYLRAPNEKYLLPMQERFTQIAEEAAAGNGCSCELVWGTNSYKGMVFNPALNAELPAIWKELTDEEIAMTTGTEGKASSDTGNVSYLVPCAQYHFGVTGGKVVPLHTPEFCAEAGTEYAFEQSLKIGQAMALVAEKYFKDPSFRLQVRKDFEEELARSTGAEK